MGEAAHFGVVDDGVLDDGVELVVSLGRHFVRPSSVKASVVGARAVSGCAAGCQSVAVSPSTDCQKVMMGRRALLQLELRTWQVHGACLLLPPAQTGRQRPTLR